MLLTEIASLLNIGTNNQLSVEQAVLVMDGVQKAVFQRNLNAFLVYDQRLSVYTKLSFNSVGYNNPGEEDIGWAVTSAGATATLVSYDNAERTWLVKDVVGEFTVGNSASSVSGNGTLSGVEVYKGPYTVQSSIPCRKLWGITTRTPGRWNVGMTPDVCDDYNFRGRYGGNQAPFETGMVDDLDNTFTFANEPSLTAIYYFVFWKNPPDITDIDEPESLVIPSAYHLHFVQACRIAAESILMNQPFNQAAIESTLGDWLAHLKAPYRNQKGFQNYTQNPRQNPQVIV